MSELDSDDYRLSKLNEAVYDYSDNGIFSITPGKWYGSRGPGSMISRTYLGAKDNHPGLFEKLQIMNLIVVLRYCGKSVFFSGRSLISRHRKPKKATKGTIVFVAMTFNLLLSHICCGQMPFPSGSAQDRLWGYQYLFDQPRPGVSNKEPIDKMCPQSPRLARLRATIDVEKFSRTHSLAARSAFLHKFRKEYADCRQFVKKAYVEAAQAILIPRKPQRFKP